MKNAWSNNIPIYIGVISSVILLSTIVLWSSNVNIAGAIVGSGAIQGESSKHAISHSAGGTIAKIYVSNGEQVQTGDILFTLENRKLQSSLQSIEEQLFENIVFEARLLAELNNSNTINIDSELQSLLSQHPTMQERIHRQQDLLHSNLNSNRGGADLLHKKIDQIDAQLAGIELETTAKMEQINYVQKDLDIEGISLKKGLIKYSTISVTLKEKARLTGELGALNAKSAELREKIIEHQLDIKNLLEKSRNTAMVELIKLQTAKAKLNESRSKLLLEIEQLSVRAPISGKVHDSKLLGVRSVIKPATAVLYIVPNRSPNEVVIKIDSRDIEGIFVGQSALLRIRAFNVRSTPMIEGIVTAISPDIFVDSATKKSYYEVEMAVTAQGISSLGDKILVQGMPVDGFIRTEDRTPLAYLLSPLQSYFSKAFR